MPQERRRDTYLCLGVERLAPVSSGLYVQSKLSGANDETQVCVTTPFLQGTSEREHFSICANVDDTELTQRQLF